MADRDLQDLVTIVGVVHHVTPLGVFLEVGDRRVFVGRNCMEPFAHAPEPGEPHRRARFSPCRAARTSVSRSRSSPGPPAKLGSSPRAAPFWNRRPK